MKPKRVFATLTIFFLILSISRSQEDNATHRQVDSSSTTLVLMCLSAHPDDEDGATLAYYKKLRDVKTHSIFFTRGEGGQNEIGSELYEDLGVLRTQETLAAAKILGSDAHFLGFPDFGFSKTSKETFSEWGGRDSILSRLVYAIRALKPDVIITNHDTVTMKPNRQHGNHQVVGMMAYEAFEKAASILYHPEQLHGGVTAWQVRKLFYRQFKSDSTSKAVEINILEKDTSGQTIEEIAVAALNKHRSQGMEKLTINSIPEFFRKHRYVLSRSNRDYSFDAHDLFSGIEPSVRNSISVSDSFLSLSFSSPVKNLTEPVIPEISVAQDAIIGLVKTYDNTLEEVLKKYKIRFDLLDSATLAAGELRKYSSILLDLRTYEYRHDAAQYSARLMDFVRQGGNIVCFYHKPPDWNNKNFAPYPIQITNERVTEENATVTILQPDHELFRKPNQIGTDDWSGWVQERSVYLPSDDTLQTSSAYQRLLAMSDEEEHQPSTSLLWCHYGEGTYTYVSLALYRQLRIYQRGALKLFFNLISQPRQ